MEKNILGDKIKALRNNKGYSQDQLSTLSQLNLRTVQRIENGETEPRGDSLIRLAGALEIGIDELIGKDASAEDAHNHLMIMNLLGLGCLAFNIPFLGFLLPSGYWLFKKAELVPLRSQAKKIVNFYLTLILLQILFMIFSLSAAFSNMLSPAWGLKLWPLVTIGVPVFKITMIVINAIRIRQYKSVVYWPVVPFIR